MGLLSLWYTLAALIREDPVLLANYSVDVWVCRSPVMPGEMTVAERRYKDTI